MNPIEIYSQKMMQIDNRIKAKLDLINKYSFSVCLENRLKYFNNENKLLDNDNSILKTDKKINVNDSYIAKVIAEKSEIYSIDESLVRAVIKAESNFNPDAVSSAGAIGIMQLMPTTAKSLNVTNPYDPVQNIDGGIRYLKDQIKNFKGNVKMALAAYNCGPGRLNSLNITNIEDEEQFSRLPKETQNYINKIMKYISEKV